MSPDEARAMARAIAHAWPAGRWTPGVIAAWEADLAGITVTIAEAALKALKVKLIDPPTWAEFMTEARHHRPEPARRPDADQLDLDGHKAAIAALRAQHKFLNR